MAITTVNKGYTSNKITTNDLYWPDKNEMFDMLQINITQYVPIASTNAGTATNPNISNIQGLDVFDVIDGKRATTPTRSKTLATVLLPVPNDINYSDQLNWSSDKVGMLGKMLPQLAGNAINDPGQVGRTISTLAGAGTAEFILNAIRNIPGAPPAEALTSGIGGKILNPYIEQIFQGIAMREFNFSWKLVPRNASEQSRIHNIIKTLRYYSLPNYSGSGPVQDQGAQPPAINQVISQLNDRWLTVPNIFNLNWKQAGTQTSIQSLPKIKPCVLKNIQVNYTPDNVWATHINTSGVGLSGPAPVAYNVTMTFAETEIITADDVVQQGGY
jgi:hypothetical protein